MVLILTKGCFTAYSGFMVCYNIKVKERNMRCTIRGKGTFQQIDKSTIFGYDIQTPSDRNGNYINNQLCTYSFPPRQFDHVYTYLYSDPPDIDIEESSRPFRCLDSLLYEHITDDGHPPKGLLTCGNHTDERINHGQGTVSNIALTFRTNSKGKRKGAKFFIADYSIAGHKVSGEEGEQGIPGQIGRRGLPGAKGNTGPQGSRGLDGATGISGKKGPKGNLGSKGIRGAPGLPGPDGQKGEKGSTGLKGFPCSCSTGLPGPPGQPGPTGYVCCSPKVGDDGEIGPSRHPGPYGVHGRRGNPGVNGSPGPAGSRGDPGRKGAPGEPGNRGPKGYHGARGLPGPQGTSRCPGITKRDIIHLHQLLSNVDSNTAIDQGYFDAWRGSDHDQHKPGVLRIRQYISEHVQSLNTITLLNFIKGAFGNNQFNIRRGPVLSVWPKSREEIVAKIKEHENSVQTMEHSYNKRSALDEDLGFPTTSFYCPKGNLGPAGEAGRRGVRGPKGPSGSAGYRGPRGFQGPTGESGVKGEHGSTGPRGAAGIRGPPGLQGRPGSQGPLGKPGRCNYRPAGLPGSQGLPGARGRRQTGSKGFIGPPTSCSQMKGAKGDQGEQGFTGARGSRGLRGDPGVNGMPGHKGHKGEAGIEGPKGKIGNPGRIGAPGQPGAPGPPGPPGCTCILMDFLLDEFNFIIPDSGRVNQTLVDTTVYHSFPGSPGPVANTYCVQGARGKTGVTGPHGPRGYTGIRGPPGQLGFRGPPGPVGDRGDNGNTGQTGSAGQPGSRGPIGGRGKPGDSGSPGLPGASKICRSTRSVRATSSTCLPGRKGEKGVTGPRGYTGYRGAIGPKGPRGISGQPGHDGTKGERGQPGRPGNSGRTGPNGYDGKPGLPGLPGPIGDGNGCPEFDGIDMRLIQPNPAELDAIKRLIYRKESDYACSLRDASQPLLQQLAYYYCND